MKTKETGEKQEKHHKHEGKKRRKEKGESKYERDEICRKIHRLRAQQARCSVAAARHMWATREHKNACPTHTRNAGQKIFETGADGLGYGNMARPRITLPR
jgi:hypothetical protein